VGGRWWRQAMRGEKAGAADRRAAEMEGRGGGAGRDSRASVGQAWGERGGVRQRVLRRWSWPVQGAGHRRSKQAGMSERAAAGLPSYLGQAVGGGGVGVGAGRGVGGDAVEHIAEVDGVGVGLQAGIGCRQGAAGSG
jgi:hypothetical protein